LGLGTPILVVDDEVAFRELCSDLLQENGYEVEVASNGQEALGFLDKGSYPLVLSDINMPLMDGLELLRRVKARGDGTELILMTAYGGLQSAVEALRQGAYDYITKPFAQENLLATVRRCLEKQRLSFQLREAQEGLIQKEKLAALGSMSGWLAHRMRNPLNVILMCAQYLKTKFTEKDDRQDVVSAIEDKVNVLEKMTRDLIEFSRSYDPQMVPEDIHSLLDRVLETVSSRCRLQHVSVEKSYGAAVPLLPLDRDLMEEVFGYLFDNGLEAMGGPGTLRIETIGPLALGPLIQGPLVQGKASTVVVRISNTGPTIPADIREKLFDPFFTTKERGTGLGLAISHRVVESHGGTISLASHSPTTFCIELPLRS
jgi:signal transduction histidine kinase